MAVSKVRKQEVKNLRDDFFDKFIGIVGTPTSNSIESVVGKEASGYWREIPVPLKDFAEEFVGIPLFPEQLALGEAMLGSEPTSFKSPYELGIAMWGKGSGKDMGVAIIQAYLIYKLMCLVNPQEFLRNEYGASLADGDAIDIGNTSTTARQAEKVYFKKFKNVIRRTTNPSTGKNWFKEHGVDIRDEKDLQTIEARFPQNINAYSLNSETNTGEGLNLLFVTLDEFGALTMAKADELYDKMESSISSRYGSLGTILLLSYMYNAGDPIDYYYENFKDDESTYAVKKATWEVNPSRKKSDFAKSYRKNPEKARMMYECEANREGSGYIKMPFMLKHMFTDEYENPIIGDNVTLSSDMLYGVQFKEFFRGESDRLYAIHFDLATGKIGNDCVGMTMAHPEMLNQVYDKKMYASMMKDGYVVENAESIFDVEVTRKGAICDLVLQITAPDGSEVMLSDLRKFVLRLKNDYGFNIDTVTYDGWESRDSIQEMNNNGINSYRLSVDRDPRNYETWKEMMYQGLVKTYANFIANREARELVNNNGKPDHPEISLEREALEGRPEGSKDVMDSIVGSVITCLDELPLEPDVFFG